MSNKNRRIAFTLAEVLITLGIIGVVAAMTIPTLIANYKNKEYSARLKKFYSTMTQAIQLSTIENGNTSAWSFPGTTCGPQGCTGSGDELEKFWGIYFAPYLKTVSSKFGTFVNEDGVNKGQEVYTLYFQDGTYLGIRSSSSAVDFMFDVNGDNGPNKNGKDIFPFLLFFNDGKFTPYIYTGELDDESEDYTTDMSDRENVLNLCANVNTAFCSQLLFLDNWEFKDDYPW